MPHPLSRRRARLALLLVGLALGACAPAPQPPAPPLPSTASTSHPSSSAEPAEPPKDPFERLAWAQRLKERDWSRGRHEIGRALHLVADDLGVVGLLRALPLLDKEDDYDLTDLLYQRADPRAGDALAQSPYAYLLFWIGDLRSAEIEAKAIASVPTGPGATKIFALQVGRGWTMDLHGIVSDAGKLAELAVLHPEAREQLRALAEEPALNLAMHYHSASAMRFLAAVGSAKGLAWLRTTVSGPKSLAAPDEHSESLAGALRALGWAKDEPSFPALVRQLGRLPPKPPGRVPNREEEGTATDAGMLAQHLSDLGFGAVQGLAEWGDPRAAGPLTRLIEQGTWFDDLDLEACEALAWCADERAMAAVVAKVRTLGARPGPRAQSLAACYAATLARRAPASVVPAVVDLLARPLPEIVRARVALALGHTGLDAAAEARLAPMLHVPALRPHAAVALVLGASAEEAARTADTLAAKGPDALREVDARLSDLFVSREDLEDGTLFRWVRNGGAVRHVRVDGKRALHVSLDGLPGYCALEAPHALTTILARYRLWQMAHTGPLAQRRAAAATVVWLRDTGPMYALAAEPGEVGDIARAEIALERTLLIGQDL